FCGADFWQDKTQNAVNPIGFTSILTKYWRKSARKKRGSDYARHPNRKHHFYHTEKAKGDNPFAKRLP
ncbi:MAG: hypothetical protein IKJ27_06860, partial [Clostridia bacterium]|nr:hypothetical protein [Clostridia bacterium]